MIESWMERYETEADDFDAAVRNAGRWAKRRDEQINADRGPDDPRGYFFISFVVLEFQVDPLGEDVQTYHFKVLYETKY